MNNKKIDINNLRFEINENDYLTITPQIKFNLVEHVIKFLLSQRQQLPLPFDRVKQEIKWYTEQQQQQQEQASAINRYKLKNFNLINEFIFKFEQIFLNLKECFITTSKSRKVEATIREMNKIVFIIGGSIVTPKETYFINLNFKTRARPNRLRGTITTTAADDGVLIKKFFRALICFLQTIDFKKEATANSNLYFLFEAERNENIKWFLPKLNYSPQLNKGKQIHMTIEDAAVAVCEESEEEEEEEAECRDLTFDSSFEQSNISGIEPLNLTLDRLTLNSTNKEECSSSSSSSDLIWYQSPNILKGVKSF